MYPSAPWKITQKSKVAPWSFLGCQDLKRQMTEQLDKPGRNTAFHQEMKDLNVQHMKGKAHLTIRAALLVERERR